MRSACEAEERYRMDKDKLNKARRQVFFTIVSSLSRKEQGYRQRILDRKNLTVGDRTQRQIFSSIPVSGIFTQ
jgi:hypothetical protein